MSKTDSRLQEGPPIYVESLLTPKEWAECRRKYNTYSFNGRIRVPSDFPAGEYKWRYGMGANLTPDEVKLINSRLEEMKLKAGLLPKHDSARCEDGRYPGIPFHP